MIKHCEIHVLVVKERVFIYGHDISLRYYPDNVESQIEIHTDNNRCINYCLE